jgi:hypothetical protein
LGRHLAAIGGTIPFRPYGTGWSILIFLNVKIFFFDIKILATVFDLFVWDKVIFTKVIPCCILTYAKLAILIPVGVVYAM